MGYVIKFIRDFEFVGMESFAGTLDEAVKFASEGLKTYEAEAAAVMDEADLKGEPKAFVSREA